MSFVRDGIVPAVSGDSACWRPAAAGVSEADGMRQLGFSSVFPRDAVACIWRPAPSPMSSARGRNRWTLRFERRSPPFIEPLMGWTGGADTLSQVELSFPSRESAIAYAERQGLAYRVENGLERRPRGPNPELLELQSELEKALASLVWLSWMQARYGRCDQYATPELDRALTDPAVAFGAPDEVVAHPELSAATKREILARWAWDEHLQQLATDEGMPEGRTPSRLDELRRALCALDLSEKAPALVFTSRVGAQAARAR